MLYRLNLESAVRLIYQLTILFPSYNAQNGVPFLVGTNEREFLLTLWRLFLFNRRYLQKFCHHLQILCLLHPHTLKQTQFFVFIHILKYVILGIRVKITSGNFLSSAASSSKSKTNTNFCVHTYSGICYFRVSASASSSDWKKLPWLLNLWLDELFPAWKE